MIRLGFDAVRTRVAYTVSYLRGQWVVWGAFMTTCSIALLALGEYFAGASILLATFALLRQRMQTCHAFTLGYWVGYEARDYGLPAEDPGHVDDVSRRVINIDTRYDS